MSGGFACAESIVQSNGEGASTEAVNPARLGTTANAAASLETQIAARLREGQVLFQQGRGDEALPVFESLLPIAPSFPVIYSCLGALYIAKGRGPDAIAAFLAVTQHEPRSPSAFHNLGLACRREGLLHEAATAFHTAVRLQPDYEAARSALQATVAERDALVAKLLAELGTLRARGLEAAIESHADRLLALHPYHPTANNIHAERLEKRGQHLAALRVCCAMIERYPERSAFAERAKRLEPIAGQECAAIEAVEDAKAALVARRFADALARVESVRAMTGVPASLLTQSLAIRGAVYEAGAAQVGIDAMQSKNALAKAKASYEAALASGSCPSAQNGLRRLWRRDLAARRKLSSDLLIKAGAQRKSGDFAGATATLQSAGQFLSDDPVLHLLRGLMQTDERNPARSLSGAVANFERAVGCDDKFMPAVSTLSQARLKHDRVLAAATTRALRAARKAMQTVDTAVSNASEHTEPFDGGTGHIAIAQSRADEARRCVTERRRNARATVGPITNPTLLAHLDKQEIAVYALVGRAYEAANDFSAASATYNELVRLQPQNGDARRVQRAGMVRRRKTALKYLDHAKAARKGKDHLMALGLVRQALEIDRESMAVRLHLGASLECLRLFSDAVRVYETTLSLAPDEATKQAVQQRLEAARGRAHQYAAVERSARGALLRDATATDNVKAAMELIR